MDPHTSATISLIGMLFDSVGGLYLAYDLLGGEKGPLSTFTRVVTYSLIIGLAYGLSMGVRFGLLAGIGLGAALGLHLDRIGRGQKDTRLFKLFLASLRAGGLGGAVLTLGHPFAALAVAGMVFTGSLVLPVFNISPALLIESSKRPSINRKKIGLALAFGSMAAFADLILIGCGYNSGPLILLLLRLSCTVVMVTLFVATISPVIEWFADHVQPRVLGYVGAIMFIIGFVIQAMPSLVVLLN